MDQYVSFAKVFGFCIILWKCSNRNIIGCNSMYLLVFFFLLQVESSQTMIRVVGLSATLPNYLEVFWPYNSYL